MLIEIREARRAYGTTVVTHALKPTTLSIDRGELVVILGPSGSGKTTLLNLIGGLDHASGGAVTVADRDLGALGSDALSTFRRDHVGFIFQFFNLFPSLTVRENVAFAAEIRGDAIDGVDGLIAAVGLAGLEDRFPAELSGGQQQRVAVARALAKRPSVLLADEPTGALDEETGKQVLALLREAADRGESARPAVLIVTHHEPVAAMADRVLRLRDGAIAEDRRNDTPVAATALTW